MIKNTVIHAELILSHIDGNPYGDFGQADSDHMTLDDMGLKTADELHEFVRANDFYNGYKTYETSLIHAEGIDYVSAPQNVSGLTLFGTIKRAEDVIILKNGTDIRLTDAHPETRGRALFFDARGYSIGLAQGDRVFDRATNTQIWPQQRPAAKPTPAP